VIKSISEPFCPFYEKEKGLYLECELGSLHFPDAKTKLELKSNYCCDTRNYKECSLYKVMTFYYEGKEVR
jgi:hypothetical protein